MSAHVLTSFRSSTISPSADWLYPGTGLMSVGVADSLAAACGSTELDVDAPHPVAPSATTVATVTAVARRAVVISRRPVIHRARPHIHGCRLVIHRGGLVNRRRLVINRCRRVIRGRVADANRCRIPDDCIDSKRYPLFMARAVLQELIESLQSTQGVKPC